MSVSISINRKKFKLITRLLVALLVASLVASGAAVAQDDVSETEEAQQLQDQFEQMANLIILVIAGVAVPNGAYGLFEWMTAGANQEKNEKGKKRIRNTFIGLAGAAVIKVAVQLVTGVLGVGA